MTIKKKPFVKYNLDSKKKNYIVISLKLNLDEQGQLVRDKKVINQEKDSTAIKQLMRIGSKVVHDEKTSELLDIVLGNKRKNKRLGINEFE